MYTDVHGRAFNELHIHGIVYASDDPALNSDAAGNYTLALTVREANGNNWGRDNFKSDVLLQGSFQGKLEFEDDITFDLPAAARLPDLAWTAGATVELKQSDGSTVLYRDYDEKKEDVFDENDEWEEAQGYVAPTPGISLANSDQNPQPGNSVTLNLVTSEPYYDVSWYVLAPWETGDRGTYQEGTSGDGTSTETSFSYTFPIGSTNSGDFLITAVIYRWSDMSSYEETYTVTVE
ncbi:MAG: hypothetical protein OXU23_28160 [Candidatus Poribacteria bacterium]|nr:hypothetical protein [Candidatus Poribacteria bacterium]